MPVPSWLSQPASPLGMVYSQLKAERITVAGVTPKGQARPSAQPEADLFNVYAPAGMNQPNSKEVIGFLLGWKPGRPGPGGNPSACRWKAVRCFLSGDNQARSYVHAC
jgi:hypothetical protein